MATDTARIQLELASGRGEATAPFQQTAQRRRKQFERDIAPVDAPAELPTPTRVVVDIPLASPAPLAAAPALERQVTSNPPRAGTARLPWVAFIGALIAVAVGVWWVMSQRMPDIDPRVVIERNLNDAQTAMADGRYTDPSERSAFHYYSTVLALEPDNVEAIAGIDAIADRQLTNARVQLADHKIAEAGVALERARRVRPDHDGLAAVDAQWRAELRELLAASTVIVKVQDIPPAQTRVVAATPKTETQLPLPSVASVPDVKKETAAPVHAADVGTAAAALAVSQPIPKPAETSEPNTGTNVVEETAAVAAPPAAVARPVEPKLLRMVQPQYPQEAMMRGLEGWVDVSLQVSPAGDVIAPRIEESSRGRMFNRAALSAVEQWKYEPRSDGTTSERVRVRLQFKAN